MEIASVGLAVIVHNVTADICDTAHSELVFDMLGHLYHVFGNLLRLGENEMVDALEDIFPFAVFDKRLRKIGIVYVSATDTVDLVYTSLKTEFLDHRFEK